MNIPRKIQFQFSLSFRFFYINNVDIFCMNEKDKFITMLNIIKIVKEELTSLSLDENERSSLIEYLIYELEVLKNQRTIEQLLI